MKKELRRMSDVVKDAKQEVKNIKFIDKMEDVNDYHDSGCKDPVEVLINKQHIKLNDKEFDSYKIKLNNKAINLSLRKEDHKGTELTSKMLAEIPLGISRIYVVGINQDKSAFYPKVYATWYRIANDELPF